jgi:hypothetical protein
MDDADPRFYLALRLDNIELGKPIIRTSPQPEEYHD